MNKKVGWTWESNPPWTSPTWVDVEGFVVISPVCKRCKRKQKDELVLTGLLLSLRRCAVLLKEDVLVTLGLGVADPGFTKGDSPSFAARDIKTQVVSTTQEGLTVDSDHGMEKQLSKNNVVGPKQANHLLQQIMSHVIFFCFQCGGSFLREKSESFVDVRDSLPLQNTLHRFNSSCPTCYLFFADLVLAPWCGKIATVWSATHRRTKWSPKCRRWTSWRCCVCQMLWHAMLAYSQREYPMHCQGLHSEQARDFPLLCLARFPNKATFVIDQTTNQHCSVERTYRIWWACCASGAAAGSADRHRSPDRPTTVRVPRTSLLRCRWWIDPGLTILFSHDTEC